MRTMARGQAMETAEDFKRAYVRERRIAALRRLPAKLAWKCAGLLLGALLGWLAVGAVLAVAPSLGAPARAVASVPSEAHSDAVATGTDYAEAYADCAAHGWDAGTVNSCRWAAAMHFGGQHDQYYYMHHTTESN